MGIVSENPGADLGTGRQDWNYDAPGRGETRSGYLAAPPLWITVHHEHGSRPCRQVVSRGALSCPMCACEAKSKQKGFVPYYSREYLTLFAIVPDTFRLSLGELTPGEQVEIVRGKRVYDPVIFRPKTFRPVPLPKSLPVGDAVDMLPSLLCMWKDTALDKWHRATPDPVASDTPVSLPADVPAVIADRMAGAVLPGAEAVEKQLDAVIGRLTHKGKSLSRTKPSANGTHPPYPGE